MSTANYLSAAFGVHVIFFKKDFLGKWRGEGCCQADYFYCVFPRFLDFSLPRTSFWSGDKEALVTGTPQEAVLMAGIFVAPQAAALLLLAVPPPPLPPLLAAWLPLYSMSRDRETDMASSPRRTAAPRQPAAVWPPTPGAPAASADNEDTAASLSRQDSLCQRATAIFSRTRSCQCAFSSPHESRDRRTLPMRSSLPSMTNKGCWEDEVMQVVLKYLVLGNTEIRLDLINTLTDGKNVQFVDKVFHS